MPPWEYTVVVLRDGLRGLSPFMLNSYGALGWEMVTFTPGTSLEYPRVVFKRPLLPTPE